MPQWLLSKFNKCLSLIFRLHLFRWSYCWMILDQTWKHSFFHAHRSSVCFFFFFLRAFLIFFCTIILTSCVVFLFFFSKCFPVFCFVCLTSVFKVVHLPVVCLHVPWCWKNVLPLCSSLESSSSEPWKVTAFLFLDPFLEFFLFLEGTLSGIDFSNFQSLSPRTLL